MKRLGVYGSPVSAITLEAPNHCLFGQGSFLHRNHPSHETREEVLPGNIHGIRSSEPISVVFGGRYLAFLVGSLQDASIPLQVLSVQQRVSNSDKQQYLTLADWIWDCQCCPEAEDLSICTLTVALAHGSVQLWKLQRLGFDRIQVQHAHTVTCQPPSLVQTLRISPDRRQIAMAQDGAIHIWSLNHPSRMSTIPVPIAGTMHALRFNDGATRLASVSNDRSVRLWECHPPNKHKESSWQERWTVWGHTARVWDVAFVPNHQYVVSTGGDSTIRLWDAETGNALYVWNTQRCMRSLDTHHEGYIAAGGDDGTVVIYNIDAFRRPILSSTAHSTLLLQQNGNNVCRFPVPDDRLTISSQALCEMSQQQKESSEIASESVSESATSKKQKKKKTKMTKQILAGAEFCTVRNRHFMVVTTRMGSLFVLDLTHGNWSQQANWETSVNAKDGCCMKIHPEFSIAAIGATSGFIKIVRWDGPPETMAAKTTLDACRYRAVQALEWVDSTTLVTYHIHTVVLWSFSSSSQLSSAEISPDSYYRRVLEAKTKGMVICGSFNKERKLFAAGDTRGNMLLFNLEQNTQAIIEPVSCLPYCHRKEHVNAVVWVSENKLLSVGNDGCIAETLVTTDCKLEPLMSVLSGQLTGITHIFKRKPNFSSQKDDTCAKQADGTRRLGDISIAGFTGNRFSILDAVTGYEFANVNTSGRHRSIEVLLPTRFPQSSLLVIRESRVDGGTDLVVSTIGVDTRETSSTFEERAEQCETLITSTHGIPLHNDSIFGLCLFPLNQSCQQVAVVCASEDCFMTLSIFQDEKLVTAKHLPPMVSSVRTVCASTSVQGRHLLAFGGGQLEIMFYISDSNHHGGDRFPLLSFIGCGVPSEKQLIDQRINAMKSIFLAETSEEPRHLVVTGDSDGTCCMYFVAESRSRRTIGFTFFRSERPILSIDMQKDGDDIYIVAGTTNGFLFVFATNEKLILDVQTKESRLSPIATYRGHSMGTNAIDFRVMVEQCSNTKFLKIASVGDDQAICCCNLRAKDLVGSDVIMSQIVKPEASLSALKGVKWTSDHTFVTVGYDQRAVHWSIMDEILPLSVTSVSIGDINCLGMCRGPKGTLVAVGGAGVELICLEDKC